MALPTYVTNGTPAGGTGSVTPALPPGWAQDDLLCAFVQNKRAEAVPASPAGWTKLDDSIPTSGNKLIVYTRDAVTGDGNPTFVDPGSFDHLYAVILAWRNPAGGKLEVKAVAKSQENTASTAMSFPALTTAHADLLIINAAAHAIDATGQQVSGVANAALSSCVERFDNSITSNDGGGLFVAQGGKAVAGATGNTTATLAVASTQALMTFSIGAVAAGTNYPQTVSITSATTVSKAVSVGKSIAATAASTVTRLLQAAKRVAITSATTTTIGKAIARTMSITSATTTAISKAVGKVVALTSATLTAIGAVVASPTNYLQTISITSATTVGMGRAIAISRSIAAAGTVTVRKAIGKGAAITSATTVAIVAGRAYIVTIAITAATSVTTAWATLGFVISERIVRLAAMVRSVFAQTERRTDAARMESRTVAVLSESRRVVAVPDERDAETGPESRTVQPENDQ